jgi:AraC-like DNA-binding protein
MKHEDIPRSVIEYIITRDVEELAHLNRDKLSEALGFHRNYLSDVFKAHTQMTLLEFINFEKMKRAERLLNTRSDLSVSDISRMLGIMKCKQFRIKFERVYGLKPGRYRKLCRGVGKK